MKGKPQLSNRADAGDDDVPDHPRVTRTAAGSTPPPLTTGANSVFAMGQASAPAPAPRRLLDLTKVKILKGVPIPPVNTRPSSLYANLWKSMSVGDMVELEDKQAASLIAHANKAKGRVETRRLAVGIKGVWRVA